MTTGSKIERDFVQADVAAISNLISELGDQDVLTRVGLEARLTRQRDELAKLGAMPDKTFASAALFFGGRPVLGRQGIESEFAGTVITQFQDIVAKMFAYKNNALGQRGMVANKISSTLHIKNIVHGSFGFLLEEMQPQHEMIESPLHVIVDEAAHLLGTFGEPDEDCFQAAVESIDDRLLATTREFFNTMRTAGATLRLVAGGTDRSFGSDAVERASDRARTTTVRDNDETLKGQLSGVLPEAHQFEFRISERGTVRGRVDRAISADTLSHFNREWVGVDAIATVRVKRVLRNEVVVRESYMLARINKA